MIDPDGASVIPSVSHTWYGTTRRPRGGARTGGGFPGMGRYRYTEKRMHRNDPLYAIGLYRTVGGASGDFDLNDDLLALLREWKADAESLLKRHDRNKDGVIDLREWEHVREAALKEVMANHRELREAGNSLRGLTDLARRHRVQLGFHNHGNCLGGPIWDAARQRLVKAQLQAGWSGLPAQLRLDDGREGCDLRAEAHAATG